MVTINYDCFQDRMILSTNTPMHISGMKKAIHLVVLSYIQNGWSGVEEGGG